MDSTTLNATAAPQNNRILCWLNNSSTQEEALPASNTCNRTIIFSSTTFETFKSLSLTKATREAISECDSLCDHSQVYMTFIFISGGLIVSSIGYFKTKLNDFKVKSRPVLKCRCENGKKIFPSTLRTLKNTEV